MKKFFKALALVLALTLVLGTVPASAAVAITNPRTEKTLFVGGSDGWGKDAEGKEIHAQQKARLYFWNALKISKEDCETLAMTVESSNPDVAVVRDAADKMYIGAKSVGEAVVTFTIDGKKYPITITVKKSANNEVLRINHIEDGQEVIVDQEYKISVPRTKDGVKMFTDNTELTCDDESVQIAPAKDADGKEIPRLWTVKFTKLADEVVLKARAFQSKKYNGTTGETSVKVKVVNAKPESAVQISNTKVKLSFAANVVADTNKIFELLKGDGMAISYQPIKDGDVVSFSTAKSVVAGENKNEVIIESYNVFGKDVQYYVNYSGTKVPFTGVGTTINDVDEIVITNTSVPHGKNSSLGIKMYNIVDANTKVEVIDSNILNQIILTISDTSKANQGAEPGQIYFYNPFENVTVTATLVKSYDNNGQPVQISSAATPVASTDGQKVKEVKFRLYKGADYAGNTLTKDTGADKIRTWMAVGDENVYLQVLIHTEDDEWTVVDASKNYRIVCNDNTTAILASGSEFRAAGDETATNVSEGISIVPVKTGTVTTTIWKTIYNNDGSSRDEFVTSLTLTVRDKRTLTEFSASEAEGRNTLNTANSGDSLTFNFTTKDQYGDDIDTNLVVDSQKIANADSTLAPAPAAKKVVLSAGTQTVEAGVQKNVTVTFKDTYSGKTVVKQIYVTNVESGDGFSVTGDQAKTLNANVLTGADKGAETVVYQAYKMAGQSRTGTPTLEWLAKADELKDKGDGQYFIVLKNNTAMASDANIGGLTLDKFIVKEGGKLTVKAYAAKRDTSAAATGAAISLDAGNWQIIFYNKKNGSSVPTVKNITIKNDQSVPTLKLKKGTNVITSDYTANSDVKDIWEVDAANGTEVIAYKSGEANKNFVANGDSVFVYSVIVTVKDKDNIEKDLTVTVNTSLHK